MFFTTISDEPGSPILLVELLRYFDGEPNYVLSGYVIKILSLMYYHEPMRIHNVLIETGTPIKMLRFVSSLSVTEFLLKFVIVENEVLLNINFKERREVFDRVVQIYEQNSESPEVLTSVQYMLTEAIVRLWSQKHKELGRFSQQMLRLIEVIIEKVRLALRRTISMSRSRWCIW